MNDSVVEMNADNAVYKTLLESTKAIPWKIDWATMQFAYIGPQIEDLLGWSPASWAGINDWIERIHPEDREYVVNYCVSQATKSIEDIPQDGREPRSIDSNETKWNMMSIDEWTSGFWPGILWNLYEYTGDKKWEKGMATFCKPFTTAKIRFFSPDEIETAKKWLQEN